MRGKARVASRGCGTVTPSLKTKTFTIAGWSMVPLSPFRQCQVTLQDILRHVRFSHRHALILFSHEVEGDDLVLLHHCGLPLENSVILHLRLDDLIVFLLLRQPRVVEDLHLVLGVGVGRKDG